MRLPPSFRAGGPADPAFAAFLDRLPRLVDDLLVEWALSTDVSGVRHGTGALVLPVRTAEGRAGALKVGFPHDEAEHEHLALRHWQGHGAVTLLRADPGRCALLLERLDADRDLTGLWDLEACEIVAGLYGRLHVAAPPRLRSLTSYVGRWTAALAELPRNAPVPHRLVEQAIGLGRDFLTDPGIDGTMIHADLHYENVLAGEREPWLAIDPKPVSGDPHYELAPMLWNRWFELAGDVRGGVRRRFHTLVDASGLDEHRARDWVVVRMLHNAMWELADTHGSPRSRASDDYVTMCVTIAKAVQD